jgi:hypothetical protein
MCCFGVQNCLKIWPKWSFIESIPGRVEAVQKILDVVAELGQLSANVLAL